MMTFGVSSFDGRIRDTIVTLASMEIIPPLPVPTISQSIPRLSREDWLRGGWFGGDDEVDDEVVEVKKDGVFN